MSNTFNFEYDATTGVLIAAALREKAETELRAAEENAQGADNSDRFTEFYAELERTCRNRAKLFEDAADAIHNPVKAALAADMGEALRKAGVVE